MTWQIRFLNKADLSAVEHIASFFQHNTWTHPVFADCLKPLYGNWVLEDLASKTIMGFLIALFHEDECQLMNLGVHPRYWRQGGGDKLLTHLKDHMKFALAGKRIFLEVRRSNTPAIALYRKHGFLEMSVRKNYYRQGATTEDALVFCLLLS